jgi:chromate transporter
MRETGKVDERAGVRGRDRGLQPAPWSGFHSAGDLLRLAGPRPPGALIGGPVFIVPGLIVILVLSALFLAGSPPPWVLGAGAAVPAVAVQSGWLLLGPSWRGRQRTVRWVAYLLAGAAAAATIGEWLVLVLLGCGVAELIAQHPRRHPAPGQDGRPRGIVALPMLAGGAITGGVLASVAWVAFKVGALSYGGGFVIMGASSARPSP